MGYDAQADTIDGVPISAVDEKIAELGVCLVKVTWLDGYEEEFTCTRGTNSHENAITFTALDCEPSVALDSEHGHVVVKSMMIPLQGVRVIEVTEGKTLCEIVARVLKEDMEEEQKQQSNPLAGLLEQLQSAGATVVPAGSMQGAGGHNAAAILHERQGEVADLRRRFEQAGADSGSADGECGSHECSNE